jgi:hypothetical protein
MAFALNQYSALRNQAALNQYPVPANSPYLYGSGLPQPYHPAAPTYTAGPMGRTVPYDPGLYGHPAGAPTYHTYTPEKGGWRLPPGTTLAWTSGKGYYARPGGAAGGAAKPAAPTDPWTEIYKKIMGSYETPAEQEARANREADAQIAAQQKLLDSEYARQAADARAAAEAMSAAGMAAAGMSKDLIGLVGGEYSAGAKEIAGLSHGLSGAMGAATAADVKGANKGLARVGAPALTEGGQGGYGGSAQMGVEDYRGGTLGSQLLTGEGEAESFGIAGMTAAQTLQATQTAQAGLMTAMHEIRSNQAKAIDALAAGRPDLYHTYLNDAKDSQIKALTFAQGILAQRQASSTTAKPITKMVGGNLVQWDPVTRTWKKAYAGNAAATAAAKAALPNSALSKIYGHIVDSKGNPIYGPGGKLQPVAKTATTQNVDLQLSRATGVWRDGAGKPIPALNAPGQPKPPPFFKPGKPGSKKGAAPFTDDQKKTAFSYIEEHKALVRAQMKLKAYNEKVKAFNAAESDEKKHKRQLLMTDIPNAPPEVRAAIGLTGIEAKATEDPHTLQQVYIDIVHSGIPARTAWLWMRQSYPQFGQGYFH